MAIVGALLLMIAQAGPPPDLPPLPDPRPMEARIPAPTGAPPTALGLADLEGIALRNSPTIAQAASRIEQARGNADQAGRYPNPFAVWDSQDIGSGGTVGEQGAFVQQPIVTGGKLRINRRRYEVDVEIARWGLVEQRIRVLNGVRLRCWQILAEQLLLDFRTEAVGLADAVVAMAREKVETGHASEADLLFAENEAEQLRLDLDQLRDRYLNSWRDLAAYVGAPGMPPVPLVGDLGRDPGPLDWEATLARLLAESPELRAAELGIERARWRLRREQVEPVPDLILRGGAAYDPANDDLIGIARVYVDLPFWDRNQGNIHTAEHAVADVRHDLHRIRLSLEQGLARRYNQYHTSLANVRRFRDVILPRALRTFALYAESFEGEDASYSRVQSALGAYVDGGIKYVQQLEELRNAETAIDGLLLVEQGSIEAGTPRPPGGGVPRAPSGGGAPVGGTPSRNP